LNPGGENNNYFPHPPKLDLVDINNIRVSDKPPPIVTLGIIPNLIASKMTLLKTLASGKKSKGDK
jgi:hypothetical protein